jgi:putative methyltransferase (TIGR04325 family)
MEHVWFRGRYASWGAARAASTGYDATAILDKVRLATLDVIAGRAACERDSVTFDRPQYSLPLLVCLFYVATRCGNRLDVLDFGGSLGSSYWQNRRLLEHLQSVRWSIVEQQHFVAVGQRDIATEVLRFYPTVDACLAVEGPNLVLLSGVLQYLESPYDTLRSILERRLPFVVLDRTSFFVDDLPERITIEDVDPSVYEGSYPAWFLNLARFRTFVAACGYRIIEEFDSWESWNVEGDPAQNKCFLLERGAVMSR